MNARGAGSCSPLGWIGLSRHARLFRFGLAGVLLVLVGCSGDPAPNTPEPPQHTVPAVFGDARTVDPCSLVDPAALSRFGQVEPAGTVSLDYCLLHARAGQAQAQLAVGSLASGPGANPGDPVVRRGSWRIAQETPLPGHCSRRVLFDDGVFLRVDADLLGGGPAPQLCGMAQTAAEGVVDALDPHKITHRSVPPNSLAFVDPCAVLNTADVQQVPGLERASPQPTPAGHQCQWGRQEAGAPRVRMTNTAGDPPRVTRGTAVEQDIGGHRTVLDVVGGDPAVPLCTAETAHVPLGPPGQTEVAQLLVALPGSSGIDACEFARGLAQRGWPHLPQP